MLIVSICPFGTDIEFSELKENLEKQFGEVKLKSVHMLDMWKASREESSTGDTVVVVSVFGESGLCSVRIEDIDDSFEPRDKTRELVGQVKPEELSATIIELVNKPPIPKCIKLS